MTRTAKIFVNGRSQAVRLPAEFRFDASEVFIRRDPTNGDVILSRRPDDWDGFFAAIGGLAVPDDFPGPRTHGPRRDPFDGWSE